MISATRRWVRRNRTNFAIGFGALGVGYLATQYVFSKISEARERMSSDRIARDKYAATSPTSLPAPVVSTLSTPWLTSSTSSLRRRFEQNQADCTITVLALFPTATEKIIETLPVEELTHELQQKKAERLARSNNGDLAGSEMSSASPSVVDDDGRSLASLQSEGFVHASQMVAAGAEGLPLRPRRSKAQLWNELKISSITRAFTLLYTLSLLTLLTRIQLNLLGRRNYLSSVVSLASPPLNESTISLENHDDDNMGQTFGNDFDTNRNYLTFSWWLLNRGWRDVMSKVEAAVKEVFGPFNPRDDIPMSTLAELVLNVRKKVEGATEEERKQTSWLPYLLPPTDEEEGVLRGSGVLTNYIDSSTSTNALLEPNTPLRRLLDETSDLISSPHFTHVLTHTLNATFSLLIDIKVQNQAYKKQSSPLNPVDPSSTVTVIPADMHAGEPRTKLANILAVITRQAHSIGPAAQMDPNASTASANEYLHEVESVRDLEAFSAVVYSSNFEWEAPGLGEGSGGSSGVAGAGSPEKKATDQGASGPISVEDSAVDLGATSPFENAWGKATL